MTKEIQKIYTKIRDSIINFDLPPNTRLRETEVAEEYEISRTPIRDVFKALEMDGLLEIHSKSGTFVTKVDLEGINNILYVRACCEYGVYEELLGKLTDADFAVLNEYLERMKSFCNIKGEYQIGEYANNHFQLDNTFHEFLYRKAGKENVLKYLNDSCPAFQRYRFITFLRGETELEGFYERHKFIVECLKKNDHEHLRQACIEHNNFGLFGLDKVIETYPEYFETVATK